MKILLVDDDAFLRDMYVAKFAEADIHVDTAGDGADALRKLENNRYDAVLLDMVMPGLSGVELINEIKSNENGADVQCVVLSNKGSETDVAEAKRAGVAGYIVKAEAIPSEVVAQVQEILTKSK